MPTPSGSFAFIARRAATARRPSCINININNSINSKSSLLVQRGSRRLLSTLESGSAGAARAAQSRRSVFQQVRWESSEKKSDGSSSSSETPQLRSVGFEDVNASLPSPEQTTNKPTTILIDVREPAELSSTGIIPGAVSIPLASQPDAYFLSPEEFETRFRFPKPGVAEAEGQDASNKSDLIFYCKAGVRARAAAQLAVQAGYDPNRIGVYDGSWLDWVDRGGKVEKWEGGEE
ncbi:hypothetical protein T310_6509 [Rasamsonia emersonii CBS 393.64]|uniref:Rhodanese domain-containing protein n=1 Tax=Rasamsonia emersonii (strain ATCC 16479 / CBS 393.64 / IMI 116815) TaxID=1408163 RepID=A0A0F4YMJ0_RASE3|nr:hypothetical protein T310_6509 [Rasamsonia emersonii CBS 393.64]KKA19502.1 hypothetical protein T310_6509 [Rasamsonia emersonii CBS 393.64]